MGRPDQVRPPPDCGGQSAEYQPNAFYRPDGDFIAWDAQNLIPQLQNDYGPLLVGVVMAHEYGHVAARPPRRSRASSRWTAWPARGPTTC